MTLWAIRQRAAVAALLSENLPDAMLVAYPDAGHGSLFQYHQSFTRQAAAFLASDSSFAPC